MTVTISITIHIDNADPGPAPTPDPKVPLSGGTYKIFNNRFCSLAMNPYIPAGEHSQLGIRSAEASADHFKVRVGVIVYIHVY